MVTLNFEFNITEDFILSRISEEMIFCHYMQIPNITKKLYKSVVRRDHKVTCGFFRKSRLYLKDFANGDCYDCFGLVSRLYNCTYFKALEIVAKDFNLTNSNESYTRMKPVETFKKTEKCKIQIEKQDFPDWQLRWWNQYGITKDILEEFRVYSCKSVFINGNLNSQSTNKCPIYGYYMGFKDVELWRIYYPTRTSGRFISNTSSTLIQGWNQLPEKGNLLVITKSMKDIMCLYSLGITALAPNSEHLFLKKEQIEELKNRFKHIIVLYDNDYAGITNLNKIRKQYPEFIYTWLPRYMGAKDISDLYKLVGRNKIKRLIAEYIKVNLINKNEKVVK